MGVSVGGAAVPRAAAEVSGSVALAVAGLAMAVVWARGEEAEIAGGAGRSTGCVELDFDPLAKAGRVCVADGGGIAERL